MNVQFRDNEIWRAYDGVFMNDKCIFMEYHDVIKTPWFVILYSLMGTKEGNEIFDFKEFDGFTKHDLMQWYVDRKHRNFFKDLKYKVNDIKSEDDFNYLINEFAYGSEEAFKVNTCLNMVEVIKNFITTEYKSDIVIYNEIESDFIKRDCIKLFGPNTKFVFGHFGDIIEDIPENSTFVFSDIDKIRIMDELECLQYRSILMCDFYRYNFNDDGKPKLDIPALIEKYPCKIDFFDNIHKKKRRGVYETHLPHSTGKR